MAAAFLAAYILPLPSAVQGSRAGQQPTRTVSVPSSGQGCQVVLSAASPGPGSPGLPGAGLAPICSWLEFKQLIRCSAGLFLPRFQGEILPRICSWLCLDQPRWGRQPLRAAPQPLKGVGWAVLGTQGMLSITHLPPGACWRGILVTLTETKGLQEISGCYWGGQEQSFRAVRQLCYSHFGGVFSSVQNKQR